MCYQIALLFHLSAALHTHTQMRIKVYFGCPHPCTVVCPHSSAAEYTKKAARRKKNMESEVYTGL